LADLPLAAAGDHYGDSGPRAIYLDHHRRGVEGANIGLEFPLTSDNADAADRLEEVTALLPNGIVLDVLVHPDDEMSQIKQVVILAATTDGNTRAMGEDATQTPIQRDCR